MFTRVRAGTTPVLDVREREHTERLVAREGLKFAFAVWLCVRIILSVWGAATVLFASPNFYVELLKQYPDVTLPHHDIPGYTLDVWNVYDTRHYITIAQYGYEAEPGADYLTAFFPGYPLLIKLVSFLTFGNALLAAQLIANISALIFFWFLYRLIETDYGDAVARRAVVFSAVFPTSFFLFIGYTESTLLAFTVATFYYARQKKWWLTGVLAGCAALTKQPGIFLTAPLIYIYWRQYIADKDPRSLPQKLNWLWILLCPLAGLTYTAYRYLVTVTPVERVTNLGAGEYLTWPGMPLLRAFAAVTPRNPELGANLMEIAFTLLMIGLVGGALWKLKSYTYSIYMLLLLLVTLCVTWPNVLRPEADIPRRALIIFPIFIYMALIAHNPRVFRYAVAASFIGFLTLSGLFVNWVFVS